MIYRTPTHVPQNKHQDVIEKDESEFQEIEKEIGEDVVKEEKETSTPKRVIEEGDIDVKNIPF